MQFLIIARDGRDAEALARRMAARPAHFAGIRPMVEAGEILVGGATLDDAGQMIGSAVVVEFPDRAALDAWLKVEPYMTEGVWKAIEVIPFRVAVPATMRPR